MGRNVHCYNQGHVTIGEGAVVSWDAVLCASTHDLNDRAFPLVLRPITIGEQAWVAAEAFVGPGVTIGEGAVLGARAVARTALEPWMIYSGDPAVSVKRREIRSQ